jgi:hypothetical protein
MTATKLRQSLVKEWISCPRKAALKYGLGGFDAVKAPMPIVVAAGLAAHEGIAFAITEQIATGTPCAPERAGDVAADAADALGEDIDWYEEGHKGSSSDLRDRARAFAETYVVEVAPHLHPLAAERHFEIDVDGVPFEGTMDVSTTEGPRDTKTTRRSPSGWGDPSHRFQLGAYALAWLAEDYRDPPSATIDYLVLSETKGAGRTVRHLPVYLGPEEVAEEMVQARLTIGRVDDAMRSGDYPRNVTSCAEWQRPCEYLSRCMPHRASAAERGKLIEQQWSEAKKAKKASTTRQSSEVPR